MSSENDIEKIIQNAGRPRYLGPNRAFVTLLFAIWAKRKRSWFWRSLQITLVVAGVGGIYGYLQEFFS
jgi:hypothetical protein